MDVELFKIKHVFVYLCVIVFGRFALQRISSPHVSLFERIIIGLSIVGVLLLSSISVVYLEDLEGVPH